jgi:hypothetical protein
LLFVIWRLADAGLAASRLVRPAPPTEALLQFDSFSRPSVAIALIKQEAERLLTDTIAHDDNHVMQTPGANSLPPRRPNDSASDLMGTPSGDYPDSDDIVLQPLEHLQRNVENLDSDLDRKLMTVYSKQRLWSKFLDRYLHYVSSEP